MAVSIIPSWLRPPGRGLREMAEIPILLACLWGVTLESKPDTPIRLVNSISICSGRVEVFHDGRWGTVCHDDWGMEEATVVCRQIGCGGAVSAPRGATFGSGTGPIWLADVRCRGNEAALSQCPASPWRVNDCNHQEDAGVVCSESNLQADTGPMVRLVNGSNNCSGRVEVFRNGRWSGICLLTWDIRDARVVCREMGCGEAISAPGGTYFGKGVGPFLVSFIYCKGTESALHQCPAKRWKKNTCKDGPNAGVVCSGPNLESDYALEMRLVNSSSNCSGRVEVFHKGQWGTICDEYWDIKEARVVCRQMGCGEARAAMSGAHFGRGAGPIWLDFVACRGNESALHQCHALHWRPNKCRSEEGAGVVCSGVTLESDDAFHIRLVNGPRNCSGRVEVFHNGLWGTVCNLDWGIQEATVVCQEMSCGEAIADLRGGHFGRGAGPIWLDGIHCTGKESTLSQCRRRPWGEHSCSHREDAAVVCSDANLESDYALEMQLVNSSSNCSGRVEVFHNRQWGTICDDRWGIQEARVVCRQMGCGEARAAMSGAYFGRGTGPIWLADVFCLGDESTLRQCLILHWRPNKCNSEGGAGVMCSGANLESDDTFDIRLVNGPNNCSGRVEVFHNGLWGTVCDFGWGIQEATVVCQETSCGEAISDLPRGHFGTGSGPIWLNRVQCTGNESTLSQCQTSPWGYHFCSHKSDVAVVCAGRTLKSDPGIGIRLMNGTSSCSGRVEVFHDGRWGTVCDDHWGITEARIVCQQMGCGEARSATKGDHFGRGFDPIWLDEVHCTGTESALSQCPAHPWGESDCGHEEDAGVVCSDNQLSSSRWSLWVPALSVLLATALSAIGSSIWYFRSKWKGSREYDVPLETMKIIDSEM